jgi:threonine/homoserine/homoserine lactone efflux protein
MVGLIATLLGVAGMYMLLNAQFMALMQILIYVGAVCVLIFFAIMLTRADAGGEEAESAPAPEPPGPWCCPGRPGLAGFDQALPPRACRWRCPSKSWAWGCLARTAWPLS